MRSRLDGMRSRSRGSVWVAGAAFALFTSFLACSGDGPTSVPELDLSRSSLTVAAGPYVSGQSYTATLTARNSDGGAFTDPVSVVLSLTGGTSTGTFSTVVNAGGGVYTASFTAITAGTATQVRATINGTDQLTSAQAITVVAGPVSGSTSTITASSATIAFGAAANLTIVSRDAQGNVRAAGGDAVVLGKGAGTSDGTFSTVSDDAFGTYSATFTGTVAGSARTITASIAGVAVTSALPAITVLPPPPSLAQSLVTVGRATLASGDTTTILLALRDAAGAPLATSGLTVAFTKGAGTSDGAISAVTDRGNGTYSALFTATVAGSARSIGATIGAGVVTSAAPTITVTPGAVSPSQSTVTVGTASLTSGASTTLTLTVRDAAGNQLAGGGLSVAFTKGTGTSDGTIGTVTDHADGTYTAPFTATTSGTARAIGATIGAQAVTATAPTITVTAGAVSLGQSTLTAGASTLVSGTTTTLTVTARDAAGNAITTGGATIGFVKGTGTADGTISAVTDNADGTYTAIFTATTSGSARTITASVDGAALTSVAPAITVTPGAPSTATSTITISRSTLFVGDTATLEVTARDAAGNLVGAGGATVAFTKGAGASDGTIGPTTDLGDGRYRATLTATTAGSARAVGATIGGVALTTAPVSFTVSSVPPSLSLSTVTVASQTVVSGTTTTLTFIARDAGGNPIGVGGLSVVFTLGIGTSTGTISATTDQGNGTYTALFTGVLVGTPREIGATLGGQPLTSAKPTITVTPGAVSLAQSTLAVGASVLSAQSATSLTLTTRDAAGNPLTTGGLAVAFTKGGGTSDGTISATSDQGDGTYTATFTATTAGNARTIGATIGGNAITSTLPSITVTAGAFSPAQSTVTVGSAQLASGTSTTVMLTARDAAGNVLGSGLSVAFTKGAGSSDGTFSAVTDVGDGTYTATFTATTAGSARAISATVGGVALTSAAPTITVVPGSFSAALSTVAAGAATLASGDNTTLTLTARDAAGNLLAAGGLTVLFTKGSGTSDGTISAVSDNADGTYTATFTATTAGTARTIGASAGGTAVTSALPTITVTPGALSLATSTVTVGSSSLASGDSTTLTLTARDAQGNALTSGGASVLFTLGAGTSTGTISATTDNGDGSYSARFTATLAGTARAIGATVGGQPVTTAAPTITVAAGAISLSQSSVTVGAAALASGDSTTLTLTARDAAGNAITTGGATVLFTKGSGTSDGTISAVTDGANGTYTARFVATTAGTARSIGATVGGNAIVSALPTITVTPGVVSLAQSTVAVGSGTLAAGAQTTLTLTTRDAAGNALTTGGLTVAFTKGSGTSDGTVSAVTDNTDGTYTATFTAVTAGTARILGATIGGQAITSSLPTVTVTPGALSLTQSDVAVADGTLASGDSTTLTLTARDAAGNRFTSGGLTVVFTKGGGSSDGTISTVVDAGDGTYTATFVATTAGSPRTIGATIDGQAITPAVAATISVSPGAVSVAQSTLAVGSATLASGATTTITLTARDAAGNVLGSGGLVVLFTKGAGTSDGTLSAVTDNLDGTYSATFTATTAGSAKSIGATIGGVAVTSTLPTITVTPGALSLATSSVTVSDDTVASGAAVTLTLTARDAAGNALLTGGATVLFTKGAGSSDGDISAVTDDANGTYTASFTGTTAGTARAIGATVGGEPITSSAPTVTVIPGAPSLAQSSVTVGASSIASGANTALTLTARDAAGNTLTTGGLTVSFTKGSGTSDGDLSAVTDNANGTYSATFTATTAGTPRAIGATIGAQAITSAAPTITVTPGAISAATSTIAASPTTILLGQSSTLTLTGRDAAGNLVSSGGATVVFTKVSGFADGPLSATTDVGNGTYTATFTAATGGAPRVIGATIDGVAVTTTLPAITVTAPPLMALASDSVLAVAQINTAAAPVVVAVANLGGGSIEGLSATRTHVSGPPTCSSVNWLAAPTFDMGGVANPVSLMTLQANATGLELGTCVRRVVVSSTTPSVAPETLMVALVVGRSAAAAGVVNVVMMGDASNNVVQTITPTPILRIDNGGRGTVTNLTATILSQSGFAECVDPFDEETCTPWLAPGDLVWSSPTLPSTLSIVSQVRPFSANATIRVAGTGMAARDFQVNVAFNVLPELVTNPRNLVVRGLSGGTITSQPVMAFNQNSAHPGLTNFRQRIPLTAGFWLSLANFNWQTVGDSGRLTIDFPSIGGSLFVTDSVEILADCTDPDDCYDFGADSVVPKRFWLRFTLIAEPGISVPFDSVTAFANDSTPVTIDIPVLSTGASEILGPFSWNTFESTPWITAAEFLGGGASTPTTLRLTLDPRLLPPGDTLGVRQLQITKENAGPGDLPQHGTAFFLILRRLP